MKREEEVRKKRRDYDMIKKKLIDEHNSRIESFRINKIAMIKESKDYTLVIYK